jgi:hypothetical protein
VSRVRVGSVRRLQSLLGDAIGLLDDDRDTNQKAKLRFAIELAHDICIEELSKFPPKTTPRATELAGFQNDASRAGRRGGATATFGGEVLGHS